MSPEEVADRTERINKAPDYALLARVRALHKLNVATSDFLDPATLEALSWANVAGMDAQELVDAGKGDEVNWKALEAAVKHGSEALATALRMKQLRRLPPP